MENMDEFEKQLKKAQKAFKAQPIVRTQDCPADEDLYSFCYKEKDEHLERKYIEHIPLCPYCSSFVQKIIQFKIDGKYTISEISKKMFPQPEEINWAKINAIELFNNNVSISKQDNIGGLLEIDFKISDPGFYHAAIDTGQIIWRREISKEEIILTEDEYNKAMESGMAASTENREQIVTGFHESCYDDRLKVTLVKRISNAILVFKLRD